MASPQLNVLADSSAAHAQAQAQPRAGLSMSNGNTDSIQAQSLAQEGGAGSAGISVAMSGDFGVGLSNLGGASAASPVLPSAAPATPPMQSHADAMDAEPTSANPDVAPADSGKRGPYVLHPSQLPPLLRPLRHFRTFTDVDTHEFSHEVKGMFDDLAQQERECGQICDLFWTHWSTKIVNCRVLGVNQPECWELNAGPVIGKPVESHDYPTRKGNPNEDPMKQGKKKRGPAWVFTYANGLTTNRSARTEEAFAEAKTADGDLATRRDQFDMGGITGAFLVEGIVLKPGTFFSVEVAIGSHRRGAGRECQSGRSSPRSERSPAEHCAHFDLVCRSETSTTSCGCLATGFGSRGSWRSTAAVSSWRR